MLSLLSGDSTWALHFDIRCEKFTLWAENSPNAQIKEEIHLLIAFLCLLLTVVSQQSYGPEEQATNHRIIKARKDS